MMRFKLLLAVTVFLLGFQSHAQNRANNLVGVSFGLFSDPFPSLGSINVGVNLGDLLRVSAGYGSISASSGTSKISIKSLGANAKIFVPGWKFSPYLVGGMTRVTVDVSGSTTFTSFGMRADTNVIYAGAGFDLTTGGGFNLGFGWNQAITEAEGGLPHFYIGYYFL